jgi:hypothetical protein
MHYNYTVTYTRGHTHYKLHTQIGAAALSAVLGLAASLLL